MPVTKNLSPEQALKRIADVCKLQADNILIAEKAVAASYTLTIADPTAPAGPNVILHRQVPEALASALKEILDATDRTITLG